ncbi:MAG: hypothetical protein Q8Q04_00435 [archaeon]|nr:hypothetical protein [archaeon]
MFKRINKKGELTTQQIVILIILIVSFALILFFIFRLNLGRETDEEICHNSVVARGSSIIPTEALPLKCQRQYVCLSADGSCEQMTKPTIIEVKTEEEVYKALAEDMSNCWWMFGEGKVNYVGSDFVPENYCSICSQIAFDDSVNEEIFENSGNFDKKEFYSYLAEAERSDGETYLSYLNLNGFQNYPSEFGAVDLTKQHYSLMGISSDVSTWGWIGVVGGTAGVVTAGIVLLPWTGGLSMVGALTIAGSIVGGGVTGGVLVAPVIRGESGLEYIPPSLIEVNSKEFDDLNCESINTAS